MNICIPLLSLIFLSDVQLDQTRAGPDSVATIISARVGAGPVFDAGDVAEHAYPQEYERYGALFPFALPVRGNHDWYLGGTSWPYPATVDQVVDGVHIVGWDDGLKTDPAKMAWLAATLNDGPMLTVLYMHFPLYSANTRVGAVAASTLATYLPMIEAADVDLVIGGHGHAYERHVADGRTYLVCGTGGADLDAVGSAPTLVAAQSRHGWLEVDRFDATLLVRFVADDGSVLDQFSTGPTTGVQATEDMTWGAVKALYGR